MLSLNPLKKELSPMLEAGRNLERADATTADEIAQYVAQFSDTLKGVSAQEKAEICREIEQHLRASAAAFSGMDVPNNAAQREAIARFGALQTHGVKVRRELRRKARQTDERAATRYALRVYAVATLMLLCLAMPDWIYSFLNPYLRARIWVLPIFDLDSLGCFNAITLFFVGWIVGRETRRAAMGASLRAMPIVIAVLLFVAKSLQAVADFSNERMFHIVYSNSTGYDAYSNPRSIWDLIYSISDKASWALEVHAFYLLASLPLILIGVWLGSRAAIRTQNLSRKAR